MTDTVSISPAHIIAYFEITNEEQQQEVKKLNNGGLQAYKTGRAEVNTHAHGMRAVHSAWY